MLIKPKKKFFTPSILQYYAVIASGVAFDRISNGAPVSSANGITWTHTPAGTPTAVAVLIGGYNAGTFAMACTYGGVTMTPQLQYPTPLTGVATVIIFGLANPPSGAQTVSVTGAVGAYLAGAAITVTGSDLTTCFRNSSGNSGTGASSTTTVSSATGDLVADCAAGFQAAAAASGPGGGQTSQYTEFWNGNLSFGVSTAPGASSITDTWSTLNPGGGANNWAASNASFKHA